MGRGRGNWDARTWDSGTLGLGDVGKMLGLGMWDVEARGRDKQRTPDFFSVFSALGKDSLPFSSSWVGGIQQILQSDWFLEREEFSHLDRLSGWNQSDWSIFMNELAVILNLWLFLHFHRQLSNASSLSLFAFRWQGKSPQVTSIKIFEVVGVCLAVCSLVL